MKHLGQPLIRWLFSYQDLRLKIQVAVASGLLITAAGLTIQDKSIRAIRDITYREILAAQQQQDYLNVVEGAKKFLANPPLSGQDQRDRQVMALYKEALVRWMIQQEDPLNPEAQGHLEYYRAEINP